MKGGQNYVASSHKYYHSKLIRFHLNKLKETQNGVSSIEELFYKTTLTSEIYAHILLSKLVETLIDSIETESSVFTLQQASRVAINSVFLTAQFIIGAVMVQTKIGRVYSAKAFRRRKERRKYS